MRQGKNENKNCISRIVFTFSGLETSIVETRSKTMTKAKKLKKVYFEASKNCRPTIAPLSFFP